MSSVSTKFEKVSLVGGHYDGMLYVIRSDCPRLTFPNANRKVRHRCIDGIERLFCTQITYMRTDEHAKDGLTIFRYEP